MPSTSEVVLGIIARSGLDPKAGYPLYAYRTSDDERAVLRSAVVGALKQAASGVGKLTAIEAAGFCLFAAEHFCRAHEGGTWSWEPIFNSLGTHLGPSTLYDLVIRGLGHWNRRVLESNHGRAFLVTLACEGGLPRALITQEGTRLRRYFEQLLSARECFQDTPAEELAQRLEEELPGSLRQDVVFGLSATLIDAVAHLRTLVGNASDPLRELDVKQPGWQTWIPLRLEDEVARDLLQGLMRQPRTSDSNPGTGVRLETRLLVDNGLRLIRKPVVPPDIAAATLAAQLRVTSDKLPSRLSLYLLWSDGTRQPLGSATRAFTQERFHTSGQVLCPPLSLETLLAPVRLGAVVGTHELQAVPLDGAELPPELPWVFTRTEDTAPYVLRGYGPVCTRAEEALVVLPSEASWRAEPPEAATELGTLERLGRRVVRLQGTLRVQHGEDSMTIRTRQPAEDIRTYAVRGELFTLGPWGSEVFRGAPRVFECREGGSQREVKAEWRPWDAAGEPWQPLGPNTIGSVALRVVQDREVCFRTRVDCLPRDAHCDIVPGKEDGEGEAHLPGRACGGRGHDVPGGDAAAPRGGGEHDRPPERRARPPAQRAAEAPLLPAQGPERECHVPGTRDLLRGPR
ncbi:STY4851/ECs_5259 family protein [Archangium gephyra]|uniref:STY4851/ECs_5259 family protein n=1 Tax=Archangium gephyra TaxID=48 RepID=UPI003B800D2B